MLNLQFRAENERAWRKEIRCMKGYVFVFGNIPISSSRFSERIQYIYLSLAIANRLVRVSCHHASSYAPWESSFSARQYYPGILSTTASKASRVHEFPREGRFSSASTSPPVYRCVCSRVLVGRVIRKTASSLQEGRMSTLAGGRRCSRSLLTEDGAYLSGLMDMQS